MKIYRTILSLVLIWFCLPWNYNIIQRKYVNVHPCVCDGVAFGAPGERKSVRIISGEHLASWKMIWEIPQHTHVPTYTFNLLGCNMFYVKKCLLEKPYKSAVLSLVIPNIQHGCFAFVTSKSLHHRLLLDYLKF